MECSDICNDIWCMCSDIWNVCSNICVYVVIYVMHLVTYACM